jgi:RNA 2',3'-cyclic 3'-phosphodiesterase
MRLFLAIPIPSDLAQRIATLARERLARSASSGGLRLMHPDDLHVTLCFLGETPETRLSAIAPALEKVRCPEFPVKTGSFGVFVHAGAVYLAVDLSRSLLLLKQSIDDQLERCGIPREDRPYHPHITVARISGARSRRAAAIRLEPNCPPLHFPAVAFNLYQTLPSPSGARSQAVVRVAGSVPAISTSRPRYKPLLGFPLVSPGAR